MEKAQEAGSNPPAYNEGYGQGAPPPSYPGYPPQQQPPHYPPQPYPTQGYSQVPTQDPPMTNQPNIVYVQPQQPLANPPRDFLCFNIFVTICCCWPIGIFAILKSVETREATNRGDREKADLSSRQARKWGYVTLAVGLVVALISAVIFGVYIYLILSGALIDSDK